VAPIEAVETALGRFYDLLLATGERRGFTFGPRAEFLDWWTGAYRDGHLILLEARVADEPLGGLLIYRHGDRLSTVHSADRTDARRAHPGILHLLRWRAIQLALAEDRAEMDLGGVDVAGARRPPVAGEPMYGLYQHKLSFGARWLELSGAHERVLRPRRYLAGRVASATARWGIRLVGRRMDVAR
jgi:lipid II:glycine glycyltransferase (peptidoglycan interpeptide bridge formation enzyme)